MTKRPFLCCHARPRGCLGRVASWPCVAAEAGKSKAGTDGRCAAHPSVVDKIGGKRKKRYGAALTADTDTIDGAALTADTDTIETQWCSGRQCCTITFLSHSSDLVYAGQKGEWPLGHAWQQSRASTGKSRVGTRQVRWAGFPSINHNR
jgi:hypothetical protein